jgi:hypothetical protein
MTRELIILNSQLVKNCDVTFFPIQGGVVIPLYYS